MIIKNNAKIILVGLFFNFISATYSAAFAIRRNLDDAIYEVAQEEGYTLIEAAKMIRSNKTKDRAIVQRWINKVKKSEESSSKSNIPVKKCSKPKVTIPINPADVSTLGITLGKTTEKEIRRKFSVVKEYDLTENYRTLVLDKNNFHSDIPIERVNVTLYRNQVIMGVSIVFYGYHFEGLDYVLRNKYKTIQKENLVTGDRKAQYVGETVFISLEQMQTELITILNVTHI